MTEKAPELFYWHVWTDDEGVSHQTRCALTNFAKKSMGGKAAPQWNDDLLQSEAHLLFVELPVGWVGDWHENPKPQWIVVLEGRWFVETMDGNRVEMGPGEVSFGGDQNAKPDGEGQVGHRSGTVGDRPCRLMLVQLDERWRAARPGTFD